jgi:membrane-associated PAP2 superfamily phosphatase
VLVLNEWRRLVWWPAIAFLLAFAILEIGQFDRPIALALFYQPGAGWLGAGTNDWWSRGLLHQSGRWLPRGVAALAAAAWLGSYFNPSLKAWRRELLFIVCGMALVIGGVGAMKELTNVDCPWDLAGFGGTNPYVPLFADRPDGLKHAACFPGAHSSSGFALLAIYFALRRRAPRAACAAFWAALVVGVLFAFGQEARGAHFLSHDLTSAALAWLALVLLYSKLLAPKPALQVQAREREREHAAGETSNNTA